MNMISARGETVIKITDKLAIDADSYCYKFLKPKKRKGGPKWESYKYFTEFEHIVDELIRMAVLDGVQKGGFDEILAEIAKTKTDILQNITPDGCNRLADRRSARVV